MYDVRPNLVIGFHGCDLSVRDQLLNNPNEFIMSKKPYDWLGHGMYFWENNHERAMEWAQNKKKRGDIETPAVIGAVLSIGRCFDLIDSQYIQMLKEYYGLMDFEYKAIGAVMPQNKDVKFDKHKDKLLRELDCEVIEFMHENIRKNILKGKSEKGYSPYKMFDSTRGVFEESGPAFPGAGIKEKTHIQICIRNSNCILGFFLKREEIDFVPEIVMLQFQ
ncbi:MAG: hypothetical protein JWP12_2678 [Bacteroidetes bacterium]|nr:hypothetical protein [Bacteroidota bacterium]